jgi:hypothetical protein
VPRNRRGIRVPNPATLKKSHHGVVYTKHFQDQTSFSSLVLTLEIKETGNDLIFPFLLVQLSPIWIQHWNQH